MISVILPIFNEIKYIEKTINSILSQDFPKNKLEIIIVDGMSFDGTREKVNNFKKFNSNIILIDNPEKIVPTGFNRALNIAKGEIIIRVDGHTILENDYINNCVRLLKEKNASNVGGRMNVVWDNIFDGVVAMATSSRFGIGNAAFHYAKKGQYVDTVYLGAWKKSIFNEIGGFDQELVRNQDDEFNFRLIQSGAKIWLDPKIKSNYHPRNSIYKLLKQYFQYGFYKVRVAQKRKGISSWRQLAPLTFVLGLFTSIIVIKFSKLPLILILTLYTSLNLIATIFNIAKKISSGSFRPEKGLSNIKFMLTSFFYLPATYFSIHFSYGLGYLIGLVFFINRWGDTNTVDDLFDKVSE